ncbi:MAG: restriction endonuclease subunit R, partial [Bacteroidales bacterium]|nr:restriction endonuclease subunit R [Bacteroidales bacterium]
NPNAQKINLRLGDGQCMGLVAITNAEKVILDHIDQNGQDYLFKDNDELRKTFSANELRRVIGSIPHLSILIDEVHHATDGDIKLRQVVTEWATRERGCCQVLGFTGTPYLEKAESVTLGGSFVIRHKEISNVVYHYPLLQGIDNFLKHPVVKIADSDRQEIVRQGVDDFLDSYLRTTYPDGTAAKMAIYCGQIETLEEEIYPIVAALVAARGWNPAETILKRHKGNRQYPQPEGSEAAFQMLDSPLSPVRIVLLVQIGTEGWDCKSLTAVLLPHEGACPKNMVLQTSCRCLRQVTRGSRETALIWMNRWNADKLNRELQQQQNITLREFAEKPLQPLRHIERHSRMEQLQVPPVDFYQLRVEYKTYTAPEPDTAARL